MAFGALGLCETLVKTAALQGYVEPSPIQKKAIPAVLTGHDVMAIAHTGTGKTAGFVLPMLQLLSAGLPAHAHAVRALILTPTRELAAQVAASVEKYSKAMHICSAVAFGGVRIEPQIYQLQGQVDILVATPGRLIDLYRQKALHFDHLEILVLDEADRMLDLGFIEDIKYIQSLLPKKRQTLMFSATFSKDIKLLAKSMLGTPLILEVDVVGNIIDQISQKVHPVDKARKTELLIHLLNTHDWEQVLVFRRTKQSADMLVTELEQAGISTDSIHANRTQRARTLALDGFRNGNIRVLVATDIAARGLDINQLPCVINLEFPYVAQDYVHRIGRTGRAGKLGLALSFFSIDETKQLQAIENVLGGKLVREQVSGFIPTEKHVAPVSKKAVDEDPYGNFEPFPDTRAAKKIKGRRGKARNKK